ncbi:MFS transporter [Agrobacterium rhizogenes]|nr:MFS transporter [Rhizobium rhizogenes]NTJ79345.1 MFS transporter [Rhizobium rhizogenes]
MLPASTTRTNIDIALTRSITKISLGVIQILDHLSNYTPELYPLEWRNSCANSAPERTNRVARPRISSSSLILFATSLAFVIICLDVTVVNVALERIQSSLSTNITGLQWVLNAYTLAFASLLLSTGALGDRFGPKPIMITGLALFTLASLACGLSDSIEQLITARVFQGVAAALCVPSSLALLNSTFSEPKARARAIGIWAGTASIALGAGPIVGGLMVDRFGWPSIFLINLPFGALGIWLAAVYAPAVEAAGRRSLDLAGQILAILALAGLTVGFVESGKLGWTHPVVVTGFADFLVLGASFLFVEARHKEPMLPLSLFRSPTVSVTSIIGLLLNFGYYGLMFAISLFFQIAKGYSPLSAGLAFLPMTAVLSVTNFASGSLSARMGPKLPILMGLSMAAIGYFSIAGIDRDTAYVFVMVPLMIIGIGVALTVPAISILLLSGADRSKAGIASGVFNAARQIGGVIGVGVFGSLLAGGVDNIITGIHIALALSGSGMVLAFVIAVLGLREKRRRVIIAR